MNKILMKNFKYESIGHVTSSPQTVSK